MKSLRTWLMVGAGVVLLALLVVFRGEVLFAFARLRAVTSALADPTFSYEAFRDLVREREALKARLEAGALPGSTPHTFSSLTARVYSRYPVGGGGRLTVDAGSDDGVREGLPVLLEEGVLLGKVVNVRRTQSEVLTVWSPEWKSSALALPARLKVLLQGGRPPRVDLVPKDTALAEGARVLNAAPEFPYGLLVGTVGKPLESEGTNLWTSYGLIPLAVEEAIDTVLVVLDFP